MSLLDTLKSELKAIGPKVEAADAKILPAIAEKNEKAASLDKAKARVRKLKAVRDPLRIEQMQLQSAIGNLDPDVPDPQTITRGGGS